MECRLDRITVHYESLGDGRPLVVLPGWPDDWTVTAAYLEPAIPGRPGWRRIYIDLPGRGDPTWRAMDHLERPGPRDRARGARSRDPRRAVRPRRPFGGRVPRAGHRPSADRHGR